MAYRPCFMTYEHVPYYIEEPIDFKYESGFALSQAQKSVRNLHAAFHLKHSAAQILEVSTRSEVDLGVQLSAFNLWYENKGKRYKLENVFQASKCFEKGGPFFELLNCDVSKAKRSPKLSESGNLIKFVNPFDEKDIWDLKPETAYYDWIYMRAALSYLDANPQKKKDLLKYSVFTDIAFNPQKSINCQARALARLVSLINNKEERDLLHHKARFLETYNMGQLDPYGKSEQLSMILFMGDTLNVENK